MHTLIAIWSAPRPEDTEAFEEHYRSTHGPLAARVPGMQRFVTIHTAAGLAGGESGFHRVAEMSFGSQADLEAAEETPEWLALRADAGTMIERFGVTLTVGIGEEQDNELTPA